MIPIAHKFVNKKIDPDTEILIIGTFNPDTAGNEADFFYGRQRNFLWTLLPYAFGEANLKNASRNDKEILLMR
jgi:G:T/U-mismatch repair DNA glycosylase